MTRRFFAKLIASCGLAAAIPNGQRYIHNWNQWEDLRPSSVFSAVNDFKTVIITEHECILNQPFYYAASPSIHAIVNDGFDLLT